MRLEPTPHLRFVEREVTVEGSGVIKNRFLQQWWAEDVPSYMRGTAAGEWRDVPMGVDDAFRPG